MLNVVVHRIMDSVDHIQQKCFDSPFQWTRPCVCGDIHRAFSNELHMLFNAMYTRTKKIQKACLLSIANLEEAFHACTEGRATDCDD